MLRTGNKLAHFSNPVENNRFGWCFAFKAFLLCIVNANSASAQLSLDRLFPPVVSSAETMTVTAEGKFATWPPKIWCDRQDVHFKADEKSGTLRVTVDQDAYPGVAWIRLSDDVSVSTLVPMLVSESKVTVEKEPNDRIADAPLVALPAVVAGKLSKSRESDSFRISVTANRPVVIAATANQVLRSPMDAVLQLSDLDGNVLAQSDDVRGLDPVLTYTPQEDAELVARIFAFPETPNSTVGFSGSSSYAYVLHMTTDALVDHASLGPDGAANVFGWNLVEKTDVRQHPATEVSPPSVTVADALGWAWIHNENSYHVQSIDESGHIRSLPAIAWRHIRGRSEIHRFRLAAVAGKKYRVDVQSRRFGFPCDADLRVVDVNDGTVIATNDDVVRGGYDAGLDFSVKTDREIELQVSDALDSFGGRHFIRLSVSESTASYELKVTQDHFAAKAGKPLEIDVAIQRLNGFNKKIRIEVADLPDGFLAEPVVSEPKGGTSKSVKLQITVPKTSTAPSRFTISGIALSDQGGEKDQPSGERILAHHELRPGLPLTRFWLATAKEK